MDNRYFTALLIALGSGVKSIAHTGHARHGNMDYLTIHRTEALLKENSKMTLVCLALSL